MPDDIKKDFEACWGGYQLAKQDFYQAVKKAAVEIGACPALWQRFGLWRLALRCRGLPQALLRESVKEKIPLPPHTINVVIQSFALQRCDPGGSLGINDFEAFPWKSSALTSTAQAAAPSALKQCSLSGLANLFPEISHSLIRSAPGSSTSLTVRGREGASAQLRSSSLWL